MEQIYWIVEFRNNDSPWLPVITPENAYRFSDKDLAMKHYENTLADATYKEFMILLVRYNKAVYRIRD